MVNIGAVNEALRRVAAHLVGLWDLLTHHVWIVLVRCCNKCSFAVLQLEIMIRIVFSCSVLPEVSHEFFSNQAARACLFCI